MVCGVPYRMISAAEAIRRPFLYPASSCLQPHASDSTSSRLIVEVGPGRGDFLFHLADANADATVVGIEIKRKRVDRLIARAERRGLRNVCIVQDDARAALPRLFGEAAIDSIHILFPDPWPKKRHAKNRALDVPFLRACCRALKLGGTLSIVTDSEPYAGEIAHRLTAVGGLEPLADDDASNSAVFPTLFAQKWKSEGRSFFPHRLRRFR